MNSGFIRSLMCSFGALAVIALSVGTASQQASQPSDGAKNYRIACGHPGEHRCVPVATAVRG